jgi:hypothetical protein
MPAEAEPILDFVVPAKAGIHPKIRHSGEGRNPS